VINHFIPKYVSFEIIDEYVFTLTMLHAVSPDDVSKNDHFDVFNPLESSLDVLSTFRDVVASLYTKSKVVVISP
jgi:hypothetical protein